MKLFPGLVAGLMLAAAMAWVAPPPWPLADAEAGYALQARAVLLGRAGTVSEPVPVLGAALGLFLVGDSDFGARLPGMLGGPVLVALAWGLKDQLGPGRAAALGVLWAFSPVLAVAGRTVGPAAWVNLFTALAAFGLVRWGATGRPGFLNLAVVAAAWLPALGPAGWVALGGLGAAGLLSLLLTANRPSLRLAAALPGVVAGGAVLAALGGAVGFPTGPARTPAGGLPAAALLPTYEPLAAGVGLAGLLVGRLRRGGPPHFAAAFGVVWPAAGLLSLALPLPADPLARLGPVVLGLGLPGAEAISRAWDGLRRWPVQPGAGGLAPAGALLVAAAGYLAVTLAGGLTGRAAFQAAGVAVGLAVLVGAGLWLGRDPASRALILVFGLGLLGAAGVHQFFRANYGPGPELIGPPRPGTDLVGLVREAEAVAGRPLARQAIDLDDAPPALRWALRRLSEGAAVGLRVEPWAGDAGLGVVKLPVGYPEFRDGPAFLRWLLYREYDRLRTVDFVLKRGAP